MGSLSFDFLNYKKCNWISTILGWYNQWLKKHTMIDVMQGPVWYDVLSQNCLPLHQNLIWCQHHRASLQHPYFHQYSAPLNQHCWFRFIVFDFKRSKTRVQMPIFSWQKIFSQEFYLILQKRIATTFMNFGFWDLIHYKWWKIDTSISMLMPE